MDPSTPAAAVAPEFAKEAGPICSDTRKQLEALGRDFASDPNVSDPIREGLFRPGARILADEADALREVADRVPTTELVDAYLGYFEVIDTLLSARLAVGDPGGPTNPSSQELELRFQAMADEQAVIATAAGLPECSIDVTATILDQTGR